MRHFYTAIIFLAATAAPAFAVDWPPLNPADLALKASKIEPDADAEALLWDVRVATTLTGDTVDTYYINYRRIKIFNDRGRDKFTTVDIEFANKENISDIAGRTIRPNGEIVELKKDAVFERVVAKAGGVKVKVKSFAMPAVESGSIVEYRWRRTATTEYVPNYFRLDFQMDIPVQEVRYHVKPLNSSRFPYGMRGQGLHVQATPFQQEGGSGFFLTVAKNIPAFKEEPDMPSEADVRPWMLLYYTEDTHQQPDKYWESIGKKRYDAYKGRVKINDEIRNAAAEIVTGGKDDEEKLRKLLDYIRKDFKNTGAESEATQQERDKVKENKNTTDTFRQKAGTGFELALLYIALAQSQGFDARMAYLGNRNFGSFDKNFVDDYFLVGRDIAVKVAGQWKFCDPASPLLPFGMLSWDEEAQTALITDPKQPLLVMTPIAEPTASLSTRRGNFKLGEDGSLEGDVFLEYTGHSMVSRKQRYLKQSPEEREEAVRQTVKDRFGGAEVTNAKLQGVSDNLQSLKISYHVKIEGYAQRTGRRLFLKCSYFSRDYKPRYSASDRKYSVFFQNAWAEKDIITYELPAGYSLEKGEAPQPLRAGDITEQGTKITINDKTHLLTYERNFAFGKGGNLGFPATTYPNLKLVFDRYQEMDDHTLIVKQDAPGGSNQ
jgi:hypothetical protein